MNNCSYLIACLWYSNQSWYRDAPLYPLSVCQLSRQSDKTFAFYSSFCKCAKRGRKKKKMKKLSQFLKSHISGTPEAILLQFGMWSTEIGGSVHSKTRLVSSRQYRATEVRKVRFLSSCQYTHRCCAPASWAARHTTMCLDLISIITIIHTLTIRALACLTS